MAQDSKGDAVLGALNSGPYNVAVQMNRIDICQSPQVDLLDAARNFRERFKYILKFSLDLLV
jgi:hypothetical protein